MAIPPKEPPPDETFWNAMIDLAVNGVRERTPTKDLAKRIFHSHNIRCLTQNLRKASSATHNMMALRSMGIFAETIWIAIDHKDGTGISQFTHRVDLRRLDNEDGRWEGWLSYAKPARDDKVLSSYPQDANMSLKKGLDLIRATERVRPRPGGFVPPHERPVHG